MHPHLHHCLAKSRTAELLRRAERRRLVANARPPLGWLAATAHRISKRPQATPPHSHAATVPGADVCIHYARPSDRPALDRLAALDSSPTPAAPMLVAEADGELRAAMSIPAAQ